MFFHCINHRCNINIAVTFLKTVFTSKSNVHPRNRRYSKKFINNILANTLFEHFLVNGIQNNAVMGNDTICNEPNRLCTDSIVDYF